MPAPQPAKIKPPTGVGGLFYLCELFDEMPEESESESRTSAKHRRPFFKYRGGIDKYPVGILIYEKIVQKYDGCHMVASRILYSIHEIGGSSHMRIVDMIVIVHPREEKHFFGRCVFRNPHLSFKHRSGRDDFKEIMSKIAHIAKRSHGDRYIRLYFRFRICDRIRKNQAPFAIGVDDLDGFAVVGLHHRMRMYRRRAESVFHNRNHGVQLNSQVCFFRETQDARDIRRARHIEMHVGIGIRPLKIDTASIKGNAFPNQRNAAYALFPFGLRLIVKYEKTRFVPAPLSHRRNKSESFRLESFEAIQHRSGYARRYLHLSESIRQVHILRCGGKRLPEKFLQEKKRGLFVRGSFDEMTHFCKRIADLLAIADRLAEKSVKRRLSFAEKIYRHFFDLRVGISQKIIVGIIGIDDRVDDRANKGNKVPPLMPTLYIPRRKPIRKQNIHGFKFLLAGGLGCEHGTTAHFADKVDASHVEFFPFLPGVFDVDRSDRAQLSIPLRHLNPGDFVPPHRHLIEHLALLLEFREVLGNNRVFLLFKQEGKRRRFARKRYLRKWCERKINSRNIHCNHLVISQVSDFTISSRCAKVNKKPR